MLYLKFLKVLFDYLFSIIIFFVLLPILIIIYFTLLVSNGFPVFFVQKRIGINNKLFNIFKFRTLDINTKNIETKMMVKYNYVKFGKFLRDSNLDELPQLINIFKGDMSLVGPRPALYNQYELIENRTKKNINLIKPGITGYTQIKGKNNMTDNEKVEMDFFYYQNVSFILDLKIIVSSIKFFFIKSPKY